MCSYGMESFYRLAIALGGHAILPNCPVCLFKFLHDQDWRIRHAAVTAIGLISDGCSKALLVEMVKFGQSIVNLMQDSLFVCALKGTTRTGYLSCLTFTITRIQMFHRLWQLQLVFVLYSDQISLNLILKFIRLWLSHLPIWCNLDEAKISH
ncbi:hypothetical protein RDI58_014375 [Solanum bulbocastanum]|uniref:Uncharacterized protein n=1 Tax=Solanum bulbocastanum TaxID=147425 RepID=A0AAN8TEU1_SOLBU